MLILITGSSSGQEQSLENTLSLSESISSPSAEIEEVSWIAGHWEGEAFGGTCEEIWSKPSAGSMMCMYKMMKDGKVVFYEFITVLEESNSLILKLKHFNPDLTSWEEKNETVDFPLVKIAENEAYFDGLTFRKLDNNTMQVFLRMKDKAGKEEEVEFTYHRVKDSDK